MVSSLMFGFILAFLLVALAFAINIKTYQDYMKLSPFECGFNPRSSARNPFSLQFFLVALIFIIFDVELIMLFPFILSPQLLWSSQTLTIFLAFLIFLSLGLMLEWSNGALEWAL